ncbi:MAG: HU family DNA-binding protein [Bacteroidaceae bacterium]|nr:HU family DNA-binding protein [Bacteroidaceae bacterium]
MIRYKLLQRKNPQTAEKKFYAANNIETFVDLNKIAEEIANQCTLTRHDIKAVLSALDEAIYNHLVDGQSVRFGDLGSFRPTLSGKGALTEEEFQTSMIKRVMVRFTPSSTLRNKLDANVKYQRIAPEKEKAGEEAGE